MANSTKEVPLSLRITRDAKKDLDADATLKGLTPSTVAANYVFEGTRRSRFPAIDFRGGHPGRVAYLAGTRWPVWLIVDLVKDYSGDVAAAAKHMNRPSALVKMALRYAESYPDEIQAALQLAETRSSEGSA
jgi:uncharacterized protein (DUF433 family)